MKILFYAYNYSGNDSGIGLVTRNLTKRLVRDGHEVHIIAQRLNVLTNIILKEREVMHGVQVHRIARKRSLLGTVQYYKKALKLGSKLNPDIIQEQGLCGLGYLLSKKIKRPYIVATMGNDIFDTSNLFDFLLGNRALKNAYAVVGNDPNSIEFVEKKVPGSKNLLIRQGLDPGEYIARKKYPRFTLIFAARMLIWKGAADVIDAFAKVREKHDVDLLLIGSGKDEEEIFQHITPEIAPYIHNKGWISHKELIEELSRSHLFLLPIHKSETESLVTLSAMACGLPVIVSDVSSMSRNVADEKNGFLVQPKNREQLAQKINFLIENPKEYEQIAQENMTILQKRNWDFATKEYEEIYKKSLSLK